LKLVLSISAKQYEIRWFFSSCSWDLCLVETGGNPNIPKTLFS
jgi:hypothetical protein